ncbi:MAG: ribose 5-phosphate isomerase B [Candidatus Omnitrophica bacterium]|nr:ribose 5-phosphate isomerase B [Candidatus Omnitrophota bacterium]
MGNGRVKAGMRKVSIGADHGGFGLKSVLIRRLKKEGYYGVDRGTFSRQPCDYPVFAARVAKDVSSGMVGQGILLCKSGGGMAIAANKFPGVRAVVCQTAASARHAREHNDANILVLGASGLSSERAVAILREWLKTPFAGGRHARRIRQISRIEHDTMKKRK